MMLPRAVFPGYPIQYTDDSVWTGADFALMRHEQTVILSGQDDLHISQALRLFRKELIIVTIFRRATRHAHIW